MSERTVIKDADHQCGGMKVGNYDSTLDTRTHITRVQHLMANASDRLDRRAVLHDRSKLVDPEKAVFDAVTPKLKGLTYGSDGYKASLAEMKVALDHHYAHNSHHPEHNSNGINGMSLLDLIEMAVDWLAATERHADGDIVRSVEINRTRFGISDQLVDVLLNTYRELGAI